MKHFSVFFVEEHWELYNIVLRPYSGLWNVHTCAPGQRPKHLSRVQPSFFSLSLVWVRLNGETKESEKETAQAGISNVRLAAPAGGGPTSAREKYASVS